jgi:hypothetical protein
MVSSPGSSGAKAAKAPPAATVGQPLHYLADEPHGTLSIAHSFGTLADGGAFESVYVMIQLYGPDGLAGVELLELDDLAAAKARITELENAMLESLRRAVHVIGDAVKEQT